MQIKNLEVNEFKHAISLAKVLINLPGADSSITLRAKGSRLYLSADTAGVQVKATMPCDVVKEGRCVVDVHHISAPKLRSSKVSFQLKKDAVVLRCGRSSYTLKLTTADPQIVKVPKPGPSTVQMRAGILKQGLESVWFSHEDGGSGDIRYIFSKGKLLTETADEYKGSTNAIPQKLWKLKTPNKVVLRKEMALAAAKSFDPTDDVYCDVTDTSFRLYTSNSLVSIPIIVATDLDDVSDKITQYTKGKEPSYAFEIDRDDLVEIAEAASIVAEKASIKKVRTFLEVDGDKKEISISVEGDVGEFSTRTKLLSYTPYKTKEASHRFSVLSKELRDLSKLAAKTGASIKVEVWGKTMVIMRSVADEDANGSAPSSTFCFRQQVD